jgi:hypothetical protein
MPFTAGSEETGGRTMKRFAVAVLVGAVVFAATYGMAASLG